ncbi:MAG: hypothetical protein HC918_00010 [Oscillatoriales cyanobacterium SM2_1_8]|nr:hypothetical protein [Oscillatoriales cyanobacterium SM2_1_8]
MSRILLQTTIPPTEDDWSIARFGLLRDSLAALGHQVTARDRQVDASGNDPVLSNLSRGQFDQVWLFAVDVGDGLSDGDCAGLVRFRQEGGGLLTARDHQDLGSSLCRLAGVCGAIAAAHHFHSINPEPDPTRHYPDDQDTPTISYPNYHSGRNGDYQEVTVPEPVHPLMQRADGQPIAFLPAHPHEGAVHAPDETAQVIAQGQSRVSGRSFNLVVAWEGGGAGRAIASSTFHHFADYNWNAAMACPSFVTEPPGNTMQTEPQSLADTLRFMENLATWLHGPADAVGAKLTR